MGAATTAAAALLLVGTAPAQADAQRLAPSDAAAALRLCVADPHEAAGDGPAAELARVLAGRLGDSRVVAISAEEASAAEAVRAGRCDVAVGVLADPGPMAERPDTAGLALTRPYYAAGYVLIRRPDGPPLRALADAGDTRIAVEGESVAAFTLRQRGHRVHVFPDRDAVVDAVADGRVRYGYLWGPHIAPVLRERADVVVAREFVSADRWRFALAVRARDAELRARLDDAIDMLRRDGTVGRVAARYHLWSA